MLCISANSSCSFSYKNSSLHADISCSVCSSHAEEVPFQRAINEMGGLCTQVIFKDIQTTSSILNNYFNTLKISLETILIMFQSIISNFEIHTRRINFTSETPSQLHFAYSCSTCLTTNTTRTLRNHRQ